MSAAAVVETRRRRRRADSDEQLRDDAEVTQPHRQRHLHTRVKQEERATVSAPSNGVAEDSEASVGGRYPLRKRRHVQVQYDSFEHATATSTRSSAAQEVPTRSTRKVASKYFSGPAGVKAEDSEIELERQEGGLSAAVKSEPVWESPMSGRSTRSSARSRESEPVIKSERRSGELMHHSVVKVEKDEAQSIKVEIIKQERIDERGHDHAEMEIKSAVRDEPKHSAANMTDNADDASSGEAKSKKSRNSSKDEEPKRIKPPPHWKETFETLREFRKTLLAPVDTMGCHQLAAKDISSKVFRFQTLVGLMLSSQTKDPVTAEAVARLRRAGMTGPTSILEMSPADLNECIRYVGFHNRKTEYLKKAAQILHDVYQDDIPDTLEGLTALPGVGPKMAFLALQCAWNKNLGIGVDVHVDRISRRLGWVRKSVPAGPENARKELEAWLPSEYWTEINPLLVGLGQTVCGPIKTKCEECALNQLCPSATLPRGQKTKSKLKLKEEEDG